MKAQRASHVRTLVPLAADAVAIVGAAMAMLEDAACRECNVVEWVVRTGVAVEWGWKADSKTGVTFLVSHRERVGVLVQYGQDEIAREHALVL